MPRQPRIIPPEGGLLHVISRGNNRRKLFLRDIDFKFYYTLLKKLKYEESIKIYHYCLMPNHVHLLVGVGEESDLSMFMKRLNLKYFYYYRKKHKYIGHLWQDRFKSKLIQEEQYLIQCGKYIELNPVKANLVKFPEDYLYSSYRYYGFGIKDKIIDEDPLYINFGSNITTRQLSYRRMVVDEIIYQKSMDMSIV